MTHKLHRITIYGILDGADALCFCGWEHHVQTDDDTALSVVASIAAMHLRETSDRRLGPFAIQG